MFVCNGFKIEEFVNSKLHIVVGVSTTRGSSRFRIKSIVKASILSV